MNETNIVTISGTESDLFWNSPQETNRFDKPLDGLRKVTRDEALSKTSWVTYHIETTAITEEFRNAQDQKSDSVMFDQAKNIDLLLITASCDKEKNVHTFQGEDAANDFKKFLSERNNPLLVNYNGFRFSDVILQSRGVDLQQYAAFDVFLEIYKCVVAAWSVGAIKTRRGWNFDSVILGSLNKKRIPLEKKTWEYFQSFDAKERKTGTEYAMQTAYYLNLLFQAIRNGEGICSPDVALKINLLGENGNV